MTSIYLEDAASARETIAEAGILTELRRVGKGTINPVGGAVVGAVTLTMPVYAISFQKSQRTRGDQGAGSMRTFTRQFYFVAQDAIPLFEPTFDDEIWFDGRWWGFSDMRPLRPDGLVTILYEATAAT